MAEAGITYFRGARKSSRLSLLKAVPASLRLATVTPPDNWRCGNVSDYSICGNDKYGICVSARIPNSLKAFSISVGKVCPSYKEVRISDATVLAWATRYGYRDGAQLDEVTATMQKVGMVDVDGVLHKCGPAQSVDYEDQAEVKAALYTYRTLDIAVSADYLMNVHTKKNGWFLTKTSPDSGIDHCVGLHGYGSVSWLAQEMGVSVPSGVDGSQFAVELYTWGSVGIVTWPSLQNIMVRSEAWAIDPEDISSTTPSPIPPNGPPGPGPAPVWPKLTNNRFTVAGGRIQGVVTVDGQYDYTMTPDGGSAFHLVPRVNL